MESADGSERARVGLAELAADSAPTLSCQVLYSANNLEHSQMSDEK